MSLNWNFKEDKMGTATIFDERQQKEFTLSIYNGNAFAIFLYEWKDDKGDWYNLQSFFGDEKHAKACLGLGKDKENIYEDGYFRKLTLNPKARGSRKLAELFLKAFDNITVEFTTKEDI